MPLAAATHFSFGENVRITVAIAISRANGRGRRAFTEISIFIRRGSYGLIAHAVEGRLIRVVQVGHLAVVSALAVTVCHCS